MKRTILRLALLAVLVLLVGLAAYLYGLQQYPGLYFRNLDQCEAWLKTVAKPYKRGSRNVRSGFYYTRHPDYLSITWYPGDNTTCGWHVTAGKGRWGWVNPGAPKFEGLPDPLPLLEKR
jgi:hypothetical protein